MTRPPLPDPGWKVRDPLVLPLSERHSGASCDCRVSRCSTTRSNRSRRCRARRAISTCSCFVGDRDGECAQWFTDSVASRLATRVQLTSDGHKAYLEAVEGAFGADVDYAQLVKMYGATAENAKGRYSPAECTGIKKTIIEGKPDPKHISTSYVERSNLTVRMHNASPG
jgi:hypothetical protein